jgi:hypothetical protein
MPDQNTEVEADDSSIFHIPTVRRRFREDDVRTALMAFANATPIQSRKSTAYRDWARRTGSISQDSIVRAFGSFESACKKFGIECNSKKHEYTIDELLAFFERLWRYVKRRPSQYDFIHYAAHNKDGINYSVFVRRFGAYKQFALEFSHYKQGLISESQLLEKCKVVRKRGPIGAALRFQLIQEAGGRCQACGRSPASDSRVSLEIDHILPFSRGGSNEKSNLQVLCDSCNRGRSNRFDR